MTTPDLHSELIRWLDQLEITSQNIGSIRHRCFMPWESEWNAIVRDETAAREGKRPKRTPDPEQPPLGAVR